MSRLISESNAAIDCLEATLSHFRCAAKEICEISLEYDLFEDNTIEEMNEWGILRGPQRAGCCGSSSSQPCIVAGARYVRERDPMKLELGTWGCY